MYECEHYRLFFFVVFGKYKRSNFTIRKDKLEFLKHLFYYTNIVLIETDIPRKSPCIKLT